MYINIFVFEFTIPNKQLKARKKECGRSNYGRHEFFYSSRRSDTKFRDIVKRHPELYTYTVKSFEPFSTLQMHVLSGTICIT